MMAPVGMGDIDLRVSTSSRQDVDLRLDNRIPADVDLRSGLLPLGNLEDIGSSDIDLRRLAIPFKSTVVHTPVREIEASVTCHPSMEYQIFLVGYVPLDYIQIRVQADWAHLDPPRQQKKLFFISSQLHLASFIYPGGLLHSATVRTVLRMRACCK